MRRGNGEGSLYYSEKLGIYVAQYYEPSGKRKTLKQKKNEKVSDFKKRFNDILVNINKGSYISSNNETLLNILEHYIQQKYDDGITQEVSYARDLITLDQLKSCCIDFINKPIQKICVEDIERSKTNMRSYSKSCIDKIWRLLYKGFKIAYSRRKITYNIMEDETLTKPISKKIQIPVKALTVEEENKLIKILNKSNNIMYKNAILLELYTGARMGEILALSKDCIDLKENTIHIYRTITKNKELKVILGLHTKTYCKKTGTDKGERTFPMQPRVRKIIEGILSDNLKNIYNLLFWDYKDNCLMKVYEINCYLSRLNNKYKICDFNLSTHNLRHTFITRCQENGLPLVILQSLVGHVEGSNLTNDIYTDVSVEFIQKEFNKIKSMQ